MLESQFLLMMGSVVCDTRAAWSQRAGFRRRSAVRTRRRGTGCSGRKVTAWHGLDGLAWVRQMAGSRQAWCTGARLGRKEVVARSDSVDGFLVGVAGYGAAVWCVGRQGGCQGSSRCGLVAGWRIGQHCNDGGGQVLAAQLGLLASRAASSGWRGLSARKRFTLPPMLYILDAAIEMTTLDHGLGQTDVQGQRSPSFMDTRCDTTCVQVLPPTLGG
ncbi:hypothetical protein Bbelb_381860 [Branchiostoma belcheri]|nr:hypothetical protein Bbelb_381860 [Branchiostoma belcheri]